MPDAMYKNNKQCHKRKRESQKTNSTISVALINIDGQQNKLIELNSTLEILKNEKQITPDIWAMTETWETPTSHFELQNYTWFGQPSPQNPLCPRAQGGIGFWVKNSILHMTEVISITHNNEEGQTSTIHHNDIMWLSISTTKQTNTFGLVYTKPAHPQNNMEILKTLTKQINSSTIMQSNFTLLGDFNAHIPQCSGRRERYNNPYNRPFAAFLNENSLTPQINPSQIIEDKHWTFLNTMGGKSVIDYIIRRTSNTHLLHNYKVHPDINLRSQHRLLTVSISLPQNDTQWEWGSAERFHTKWTDETKTQYKN